MKTLASLPRRKLKWYVYLDTCIPISLDSFRPTWANIWTIIKTETDFRPLLILCNLMHLRNDKVPDSLEPRQILKVAVSADKFDCLSIVAFAKHA